MGDSYEVMKSKSTLTTRCVALSPGTGAVLPLAAGGFGVSRTVTWDTSS